MKYLFFLLSLVIISSCNSFKPMADYDKKIDFSTYKTFSVCDLETEIIAANKEYDNDDSRKVIKEIIKDKLVNSGYIYNEESPDVLVSYEIKFEDKTLAFTQCRNDNDYDFWESCTLVEYPYTEGSMIITTLDNSTNKIVWISSLEDAWTKTEDKNYQKKMKLFIDYLLQDFPIAK